MTISQSLLVIGSVLLTVLAMWAWGVLAEFVPKTDKANKIFQACVAVVVTVADVICILFNTSPALLGAAMLLLALLMYLYGQRGNRGTYLFLPRHRPTGHKKAA